MPEIITYPISLNTDFDKLCAIYSLLEQMRLEHNRVGEIARSDWENYQGNWIKYDKVFKAKLLPLLIEQDRLREKLKQAEYPDWKSLTEDEKFDAERIIYGDKQILKLLPTEARTDLLDELKSIKFLDLESEVNDPTENFTSTTWNNGVAQSDPNSRLTITADKVTATAITRNEDCYFYRASTLGTANFSYKYEFQIDTDNSGRGAFVHLANFIGDIQTTGIAFGFYYAGGLFYVITWENGASQGSDNWNGRALSILYFNTLERVGTTLTNYVYSDSARTNLLDSQTKTNSYVGISVDHLYSVQSNNTGSSSSITAFIQNLDLQEASTVKTATDSGNGAESKGSGNPIAALSKLETGSGVDSRLSFLANLERMDSGSGTDSLLSLPVDLLASETGSGIEQSLFSLLLLSSESGSASDAVVSLLTELLKGDNGSGIDGISSRGLVLPDSGAGADLLLALLAAVPGSETGGGIEQSLLSIIVAKFSSESGAGLDVSALIRAFVSADGGIVSDFSKLMKDILGSDGGTGWDALKAQVAAAGSGLRLHDRQGRMSRSSKQVGMPFKGVNL